MKNDLNSLAIVTLTKDGQRSLASLGANSGVISASLHLHRLSFTNGNPTILTTELKFSRAGGTGVWKRSRIKSDSIASNADTLSGDKAIGRTRGKRNKSPKPTQLFTDSSDPQESGSNLSQDGPNSENP